MLKTRRHNKIYKSFENGVGQIKSKDCIAFRKQIMQQLSVSSDNAFYKRIKGHRGHSLAEVEAINVIFKKYGVTDNIWSEPKPE